MRNYRIYIHIKKKKSKIKKFVDETDETLVAPDVSIIQKSTEILEPSQCLDHSQLANYIDDWKKWLSDNSITSMASYKRWFDSNISKQIIDPKYGIYLPTDLGSRCFKLVSSDRLRADTRNDKINPAIMDQIAPLVSTKLTKDLLYKFLSDHFNGNINLKILEKFMKDESNYLNIRYVENDRTYQRKGIVIDGIVYPWISDYREGRGGEYDRMILSYIKDYINKKSGVNILTNYVNINDADPTQIQRMLEILVEDMKNKEFIDYNYDDFDKYSKKFLRKTQVYSQIQNYFILDDIPYVIPSTRYMSDEVRDILLPILIKNRTKFKIGTGEYIIKCVNELQQLFPNYDFIFDASIIRYFKDFKIWLNDNLSTRNTLSTSLALDYLIENNNGSNLFTLSTLEHFPDSFEVLKNSDGSIDVKVSQPINRGRKKPIEKRILLHKNLEHSQVNPTKYKIDLLVVDKISKKPIVAYESDGQLHYELGRMRQSTPDRFLTTFINDQLQNVFLREKGIDVVRLPHRRTVGLPKERFCEFVKNDLQSKLK